MRLIFSYGNSGSFITCKMFTSLVKKNKFSIAVHHRLFKLRDLSQSTGGGGPSFLCTSKGVGQKNTLEWVMNNNASILLIVCMYTY